MDSSTPPPTIENEADKAAALERIAQLGTVEPGSSEDKEMAALIVAISEFVSPHVEEDSDDGPAETEL
jgi:hypothetical protein